MEKFSNEGIIRAIDQFLEFGEKTFKVAGGHQGYFSGIGFAARCLRFHKNNLTQPVNKALSMKNTLYVYDNRSFNKDVTFMITKEDKTDCLSLFEKIKEKFKLEPGQYLSTFCPMLYNSNTIKIT